MPQTKQDKAYEECEKMLHGIAHKYANVFKIDKDELMSECNLAFLKAYEKWDGERSLSTYVYGTAKNMVIRYSVKKINRGQKEIPNDILLNFGGLASNNEKENYLDRINQSLTEDSLFVVEYILKSPNRICKDFEFLEGRDAVKALKIWMRDRLKWTYPQIWDTTRELKKLVRR
jgi:RNA polymerase sigma factor (sigma-70 family)